MSAFKFQVSVARMFSIETETFAFFPLLRVTKIFGIENTDFSLLRVANMFGIEITEFFIFYFPLLRVAKMFGIENTDFFI